MKPLSIRVGQAVFCDGLLCVVKRRCADRNYVRVAAGHTVSTAAVSELRKAPARAVEIDALATRWEVEAKKLQRVSSLAKADVLWNCAAQLRKTLLVSAPR